MSAVHYMAVLEKEPDSDYCIYFPDLPGWEAVQGCSLGEITNALFEAGGQYRRNM